jgi:hypothetical protein
MWTDIFVVGVPVIEKIVRPIVVYFFLVLLLRAFGKRELAQLNPFDLVVLLSLSNTVQNAIIGNDNSLSGGLIGAFTLLARELPGGAIPVPPSPAGPAFRGQAHHAGGTREDRRRERSPKSCSPAPSW